MLIVESVLFNWNFFKFFNLSSYVNQFMNTKIENVRYKDFNVNSNLLFAQSVVLMALA